MGNAVSDALWVTIISYQYGYVVFLYVFIPVFMWELQKTLLQ